MENYEHCKAEQARLIRAAKGARVDDQAALHGLLIKIRNLGLSLISVHRIEPNVPAPQQRQRPSGH
jgi:hypothetical protein